jgi:PAB-dependent poly(A)-specific ribonuclease subunit 3
MDWVTQLNYHLYTAPIPSLFEHSYFLSSTTREDLQRRSETIYFTPPHSLNLPDEIQGYHTLSPLEFIPPSSSATTASDDGGGRRKWGNWYSGVYRATKASDGVVYSLRRIESMSIPISHSSRFPIPAQIRH